METQRCPSTTYTSRPAAVRTGRQLEPNPSTSNEKRNTNSNKGLADLVDGRSTAIDSPEAAQAFGEKIKQRGRELQAERENAAR
jgi:hypothetical protein